MSTGTIVLNIVFLVAVAAFLFFIAWLMWLFFTGRQRRGREQAVEFGDFPALPDDPGELIVGPTPGVYSGTSRAENWIDRVQVADLGDRAACSASGYTHGIAIERRGASTIWIPVQALVAVRTTNRAAGKVMTADGLLAIDWALPGGTALTTALRADAKADYPHWLVAYPGAQPTTDPDAAE